LLVGSLLFELLYEHTELGDGVENQVAKWQLEKSSATSSVMATRRSPPHAVLHGHTAVS
jgi:hypothetical protein